VPTNKQRRDAARRHLERQLERRQAKEVTNKRRTLIATIAGSLVVVVAVVVVVVLATGGNGKKTPAAASSTGAATSGAATSGATTPAVTTSPTPSAAPSTSYPPAKGAAVTFNDVTVTGAADLKGMPGVTSKGKTDPAKLEFKDLVVGTGKAATASSTVNVQYVGVLYKGGTKPFDSSWSRGAPTSFGLAEVVKGFTEGIGGTTGVPAMKIGGRRIVIMPSALGYGAQAQSGIPANSPLVFVIDLVGVS
jgi:peptidylprolyl isomerase